MSTRYGDRGSGRYGDSDEERGEERDYERDPDRGDYGSRPVRGSDYGTTPRGYASGRGSDPERDDNTRDYSSREYGSREYGPRYGREGILGGYAGSSSRRHEGDEYGRDYGRREYGRDYGRDYGREGREPERGRIRGRVADEDRDRVRAFDTDYGRTTSRFYGRSGYDYGRDDYEDRPERVDARGDYGRRAYGARPDEREGRGRGWWDRAADEVLSWFGDEEAVRRRRTDDPREARAYGEGKFRGRGPKNYRRSDERIREEISDRLTDNEWIDASDVDLNIANGEVILSGTVDSRYAKRLAEDIAESVSGVANVQNNLRVRNYQAAAPDATDTTATVIAPDITSTTGDITGTSDANDLPPTDRASRAAGRS
jgi:osmotically-inducible protein OsmY